MIGEINKVNTIIKELNSGKIKCNARFYIFPMSYLSGNTEYIIHNMEYIMVTLENVNGVWELSNYELN